MAVRIDAKIRKNMRAAISKSVHDATYNAMVDVVNNLVKASSQAAPHDKGILEKSWSSYVGRGQDRNQIIGVVSYAAYNENFNYAIKMHETDYNLGEGSQKKQAATGGGVGMSGKRYPVGKKFLTRVLEGERETYVNYIEQKINESLN
jgi:hypothetical protein